MSKDLLVLADQYAAATATFARALALKDEADSMSPIAREAGDKRAVLAEALAALDTVRPVQVNAMLMEALERMVESVTGVDQVSAVDEARAALTAAKQAQPEPRPTEDALWDETLKDRDAYHQFADDLAAQIAAITGVDIGEHSSVNNPWQEAMLAADDFIATQLKTMLLQQAQPEPVNQVLLKALSAMLTHSGMNEDEWSKPTFDQARAAIMLATTKTQECGMCGYVGTKTDAVGQCPRCHWDELQAQPEPYGYHSPKTGKVYASTEAASMAMAGEVKTVYLAQPERAPLSDAEIEDLRGEANRGYCIDKGAYFKAFRDAEQAHGIKQGGQHD